MPHLEPIEYLPARVDTSKPITWGAFEYVHRGLKLINYQQFKNIVLATINCGDDYVAAAWCEFHSDRLDYCLSRNPPEQGYALVNLAYVLNADKKEQP